MTCDQEIQVLTFKSSAGSGGDQSAPRDLDKLVKINICLCTHPPPTDGFARAPRDLDKMAKIGEKYLEAHGRQLHQGMRIVNKGNTDFTSKKKLPQGQSTDKPKTVPICYNCKIMTE